MFRTCDNKGFQMTFKNGLEISVQWGPGNYCDNRRGPTDEIIYPMPDQTSNTAEVAILYHDPDGNGYAWVTSEFFGNSRGGDVEGYVTPEKVAELMHTVSKARVTHTRGKKIRVSFPLN